MKKILDNSAVSSMGFEIQSFEMLHFLSTQYEIIVPKKVKQECYDFGKMEVYNFVKNLPNETENHRMYNTLIKAIPKIDYRLGPGEIDCIATSIILTSNGVENYVVIDESLARSIASNIHNNPIIKTIAGKKLPPLKLAGTIGIIKHLRDKGLITANTCKNMAYDLEKSDFRITEDLLNLIR